MLQNRSLARIIQQLTQMGDSSVRIARDDFRTGHALLHHVRRLPIHAPTIGRRFIAAIGTSIIGLEHVRIWWNHQHRKPMRKPNRIEQSFWPGVATLRAWPRASTAAHRAFLYRRSCSHVQGCLTGWPMPLEDALRLLRPGSTAATIGARPPARQAGHHHRAGP